MSTIQRIPIAGIRKVSEAGLSMLKGLMCFRASSSCCGTCKHLIMAIEDFHDEPYCGKFHGKESWAFDAFKTGLSCVCDHWEAKDV